MFKPIGPPRSLCDNPTTFLLAFQQIFFPEAGTLLLP
jgi:hypothetical protein